MTTLEFVSTSADGIAPAGVPLVTAPALTAGLGSHPTLTIPLLRGRPPALGPAWQALAETADFFGTDIPDVEALHTAVTGFADRAFGATAAGMLAADITVLPVGGRTEFVVSGRAVEPTRAEAVRLATEPPSAPLPRWRELAGRTTSRAAEDLTRRDLRAAGYADVVAADGDGVGRARFGTLIFALPAGRIGTGTERLARLQAAGLHADVRGSDATVDATAATAAWWVSPDFETHPVRQIGARDFEPEVTG